MSFPAISRFIEAIGTDASAEVVATAFAHHLSHLTADALPANAQPHWRDVARLLRSPAEKPIPERAVAAIKSWPAVRIGELFNHIRQLHALLEKAENDRLEDEIRDSIRRHYL